MRPLIHCSTDTIILVKSAEWTYLDFDNSCFNENILVLCCKNTLANQLLCHGNRITIGHTQVWQIVQKPVGTSKMPLTLCTYLFKGLDQRQRIPNSNWDANRNWNTCGDSIWDNDLDLKHCNSIFNLIWRFEDSFLNNSYIATNYLIIDSKHSHVNCWSTAVSHVMQCRVAATDCHRQFITSSCAILTMRNKCMAYHFLDFSTTNLTDLRSVFKRFEIWGKMGIWESTK